jgi:hypothetical protein
VTGSSIVAASFSKNGRTLRLGISLDGGVLAVLCLTVLLIR